ncbi:unnamed protein product, partial [Meganyctiphanes norvegica]
MHIKCIVNGFVRGVKDSLRGFYLIFHYDTGLPEKPRRTPTRELTNLAKRRAAQNAEKSQKQTTVHKDETRVTQRVLECCGLNGLVFGLSLVMFEMILLPTLSAVFHVVLGDGSGQVWGIVKPLLTVMFDMLWVLPIFLLSRIINTIWFQDIADSAYRQRQGRPMLFPSISKLVADVLISIFIQLLFLMQANLVMQLPLVGLNTVLGCIHMCLLNALYSFEYRWFNMGWELYKRLKFIEEHWPYFLGFGLPLALITMYPTSMFISKCTGKAMPPATIFGLQINKANPFYFYSGPQLQLFSVVVGVSNKLAQFLFTKK